MTTTHELIAQGNQHREQREPEQALACYIQAIALEHDNPHAWNNYGNVIREMGFPGRAIPFLQQAMVLDPKNTVAQFNLAVAHLLRGDYRRGWVAYEARWQYEHLAGTFPTWPRPWSGENVRGRTVLVWGEQGLGDCIQFLRFALLLAENGARVRMQVPAMIAPLLGGGAIDHVSILGDDPPEYDYWVPMMSLPRLMRIELENLPAPNRYIQANSVSAQQWRDRLGVKKKLRVAFSWSGRRDSWINQHKSVPFGEILELVRRNPEIEWINLQVDCSAKEEQQLIEAGARTFPGTIQTMSDTAGLISQADVVLSVDTAVSHLAGAMGAATWIMLNQYAQDWRWLLNRNDSPWYPSARLFRQPRQDDWRSVTAEVERNLKLFKI